MEFEQRNHARAEATSFCHYLLAYQAYQAFLALFLPLCLSLFVWSAANTSSGHHSQQLYPLLFVLTRLSWLLEEGR